MRHVFTDNSTIAELWATQAQHHARNKRHNFYFTGKTIYSYGKHFPIAIIEEKFGRSFVIYNSRGYSRTTNRHQSAVCWEIRLHLARLPRLELPLAGYGVDRDNWLAEQMAIMQQHIQDLNNPRKTNPPTKEDFNDIINRLNKAEYYLNNDTDPLSSQWLYQAIGVTLSVNQSSRKENLPGIKAKTQTSLWLFKLCCR